jgi:hypothetical protein
VLDAAPAGQPASGGKRGRTPWSFVAQALVVIAALVALDVTIRAVFFPRTIFRDYVTPYPILRDRTFSQNWSVFFGVLSRLPRPDLRVALVGDSTVFATEPYGDEACVAMLLRTELRGRYPDVDVEVVDASALGLFGADAALVVNKLLQQDLDILVYGVTLRAFPTRPPIAHMTSLGRELGPGDIARLVALDQGPWLWHTVGGSDLATGLVHSSWALYAYRVPLKRLAWRRAVAPLVTRPSWQEAVAPDFPPQLFIEPERRRDSRYRWTRPEYGSSNANWQALTVIGELCERYAPGRCLLYTGPVNPAVRDRLTEPGLYEEYVTRVRTTAARHGLGWRDYSDALSPDQFRRPLLGETDPIHMNQRGGAELVALIADALRDTIDTTLARRPDRGQ